MSNTIYLGIDPGASGGFAALLPDGSVWFKRMPKVEEEIWDLVKGIGQLKEIGLLGQHIQAVIERINPGFGGTAQSSMAKLYGSYMSLRMSLVAVGTPFEAVQSQKMWRNLGIPPRKKSEGRSDWKRRLRQEAEKLFPQCKMTNYTADAFLIAQYCKITHQGD